MRAKWKDQECYMDESNRVKISSVEFAAFSLFMLCLGMAMGWGVTRNTWKEDAVERGHAKFYFDKDHSKQWRWLIKGEPLKPRLMIAPSFTSEPVSVTVSNCVSEPMEETAPFAGSEPTQRREP